MDRQKIKHLILYGIMIGCGKIPIAECYPFVPAVFGVLLLEEINRTLLMIFALFGIVLFLPVQAIAKYGIILLISMTVVKIIQWMNKACKTSAVAATMAITTFLTVLLGDYLKIRNQAEFWIGMLECVFVVCFIYVASPLCHSFLHTSLRKRMHPFKGEEKTNKIPEQPERLQEYAEVFHGLSHMFGNINHQRSEVSFQQEVTTKICVSCHQCVLCLETVSSPLHHVFHKLMDSLEQYGLPEREVYREFEQGCPYAQTVVEEAMGVFEKTRLNQAWYQRLLENREIIAQQLDAMGHILTDCAKESIDVSKDYEKQISAMRYLVKERGVVSYKISIFKKVNGRISIRMEVNSKNGKCVSVKEIAKAVTKAMNIIMIPSKNSKNLVGKDGATIVFEEAPTYENLYGVARIPKEGERILGDNYSFLDLEGGQCVLVLSDGMGSGIRACKESEMVVELIERFLEAGFQKETAIGMMNSAMVLHDEDGMYSTLDLASIDLYTGKCEFYKIGAAATFVKHGDQIQMISSASLPAGVFAQVEIEKSICQLSGGDFVIMMSDGAMDYLNVPNPEETMKGILQMVQTTQPEKMAKQILELILQMTGKRVPDDMTVLTVGIWER